MGQGSISLTRVTDLPHRGRSRLLVVAGALLCATTTYADILPGMHVEPIANTSGFLTSIAFDSAGTLFYSTREGNIFRIDRGESALVAKVDTVNDGNAYSNAGLLGIVFAADGRMMAHWVSPDVSSDVIGRVDPATGTVTEIDRLFCNDGRTCSTEHHGGNLTLAPDGSIFFGLGDFFLHSVHPQNPSSPGGKIHRLLPDGRRTVFASGARNPFDMAWDATTNQLVVADNGTGKQSDEINLVVEGDNLGWPIAAVDPIAPGMKPPAYVFDQIVAPTGVTAVSKFGPYPMRGVLVASYVTQSIYYFPDLVQDVLDDPIIIVDTKRRDTGLALVPTHVTTPADDPIIDVVTTASGELYFGTPARVFALAFPQPGDVDGDGAVTRADLDMLRDELAEGAGEPTYNAQRGAVRASWGADVDMNGSIDEDDLNALSTRVHTRRRAVRR